MKRIKILFFLYLIVNSEAYWLSSPIIWESNGQPVLRGINKGIFISFYDNHCDWLKPDGDVEKMSDYERELNDRLMKSCEEKFQRNFIEPLKVRILKS
jgi:hypothetical protein